MERDIIEAALSVLNSCTTHEPPNEDAVATIAAHHANPEATPIDEMARSVVEQYLNIRNNNPPPHERAET